MKNRKTVAKKTAKPEKLKKVRGGVDLNLDGIDDRRQVVFAPSFPPPPPAKSKPQDGKSAM